MRGSPILKRGGTTALTSFARSGTSSISIQRSGTTSIPLGPSRSAYDFGPQLGRGSYGVVYKVTRLADGESLVCKELDLRGMGPRDREEASREVAMLRRVSAGCEFVVQYAEHFIQNEVLHIVMEYCGGGDLDSHIRAQEGPLEEREIWRMLLQVTLGLRWLHEHRIMHRDLKALNVFLTEDRRARIGDLGVSRLMSHSRDLARTVVGTPYYLSPEVLEEKPYCQRSDIWALGCILFELCARRRAFEARNQAALILRIVQGQRDELPEDTSRELLAVVDACLQLEPKQRPTAARLLEMPAAQSWAESLGLCLLTREELLAGGDPEKQSLARRARLLSKRIVKLYDGTLYSLSPESAAAFEKIYLFIQTKCSLDKGGADSDSVAEELETYVCQHLPTAETSLLGKVCDILALEQEHSSCLRQLEG